MQQLTCVIIGGGYAGIHAVKAIQKRYKENAGSRTVRFIVIDKHDYHLRKVLLFKPTVSDENITIPLAKLLPTEVEFLQATVTKITPEEKVIRCLDADGNENFISYDYLILALGSVVRQPEPEQGGIPLVNLEAARAIHKVWHSNLQKAVTESDERERQRLMTIAVAGAGISGIETSAELAHAVREVAAAKGLDLDMVNIVLINANDRLLPEAPPKVAEKLESHLAEQGVGTMHGRKVLQEKDGLLTLSSGETMSVGLCIWTLGLLPNPVLRSLGIPLTPDGHVLVDESYRVQGAEGVYSIGDCAAIVDPISGRVDGKTCKEAIAQADRLGKILLADVLGRPAPKHKAFMDFFCVNLGPQQALVWTQQWGIDFTITGKLAAKIRKLTWNTASFL